MDQIELTEASQVFTPLKAVSSFQIAQDEEEVLTKIPHGLTAKKENRRKSYHYDASKNSASEMLNFSPMRVPLTAPRSSILNSHPITDGTGLAHTKRSLMSELYSLKGGKENENTPIIAKTMSPVQISPIEMSAFSNPESTTHKRRSSLIGSESESPATKIQKIDALFDVDTASVEAEENEDEYEDEGSSNEELSRIEPFAAEKAEQSSSTIIPTQEDLVQIDQERTVIHTPSRFTEPVAVSPATEQHSRLMNDTALLLDTSKSPEVDDSFVSETPLPYEHGIETANIFVDLGHMEDYEPSVSPEKHTHMASPNKKPFFTITQVHEIQSDFKREVEKLEENMKAKSQAILELNNELNECKNKIFKLEDDIESFTLQKKQLVKENELLQTEHDIFRANIATIEATVEKQDQRWDRNKFVIGKFKEKVKELDSTIQQKTNEVAELHKEIESKSRAITTLTNRVSDYEKQAQSLSTSLHQQKEDTATAIQRSEELEANISELKTSIEQMTTQRDELSAQVIDLQQLLEQSRDENNTMMSRYAAEEEHAKEAETKYETLNLEIVTLTTTIKILKQQLEDEKRSAEQNVNVISDLYANTERDLKLKNAIVTGLQGAVSTLRNSNASLRNEIASNESLLKQTQTELSESAELLTVRKAEVDELNIEMQSAQEEMENLRSVVEQKNVHITDLRTSLEQYTHALEEKELVIRNMDLEIQKQEGEHLAELEAFHAEMSNVQSIVSSKSNELFKIKEEKDNLQREHDMLKYEYQTMRDESGDYDTRISNLKAKLQEYKAESQETEAIVKRLEEEKAQVERDTDKRLQQLAEDLYIQYSKKHEQKVQVLKKGYESKWQNKVAKAESESEKLRREIEGLNARLEKENMEKNEIIKLWEQYKEAEGQE